MEHAGVLYIAFGERYRREAIRSLESLRRFHPEMPCRIITDSLMGIEAFDKLAVLREPEPAHPLRAKPIYFRETPFERTLFLDTDTTVVRPIDQIFHLLDRFDIGLHLVQHYTSHPSYHFLPTPNSGVVLYRRSEVVEKLFDRWLEMFDEVAAITHNRSNRIPDDPILMHAIFEVDVRLVPLPPGMNFLLGVPTATGAPIHIVHGRHPAPAKVARIVDKGLPAGLPNPPTRVWVPQLGTALPDGSLRGLEIWLRAPLYAAHAVLSRLWAKVFLR